MEKKDQKKWEGNEKCRMTFKYIFLICEHLPDHVRTGVLVQDTGHHGQASYVLLLYSGFFLHIKRKAKSPPGLGTGPRFEPHNPAADMA